MKRGKMECVTLNPAATRLAELKTSSDCIPYCERVSYGPGLKWQLSIYGAHPTREIFLEVAGKDVTRVQSFMSRMENFPPEERREGMPMVDMADAFALARQMCRGGPTVVDGE